MKMQGGDAIIEKRYWRHVLGAGILGGIGFTMSIFITNQTFAGDTSIINAAKMAIFLASLMAGTLGFLWLKWVCRQTG